MCSRFIVGYVKVSIELTIQHPKISPAALGRKNWHSFFIKASSVSVIILRRMFVH